MSSHTSAQISARRDQRLSTDPTSAALRPSGGRPGATPQRDLVIASLLRFPSRGPAARRPGAGA
jgi:hypothetical protein